MYLSQSLKWSGIIPSLHLRTNDVITLRLFILLRCGNEVQHLKVLQQCGGRYFLWVQTFYSINKLVQYHYSSSVTRDRTLYLCDVNMHQVRHWKHTWVFYTNPEGGFMRRCTFILQLPWNVQWAFVNRQHLCSISVYSFPFYVISWTPDEHVFGSELIIKHIKAPLC